MLDLIFVGMVIVIITLIFTQVVGGFSVNKLKECGGECVLFSGKRVSNHLTSVSSSLELCGSRSNYTSIFS